MGGQSSSLTGALVTVVGGGPIDLPAEIIFPICKALIPTRRMMSAISPPVAYTRLRRLDFILGSLDMGFATSCISWFALRFKQQRPKPPCHFQLPRASFRGAQLRRLQNVPHQHSAGHGKD